MKFIGYWQSNSDDWDKMAAKNDAIQVERKQYPDRYPKKLRYQDGSEIGGRTGGLGKGFVLYEGTEEQLINLAVRWWPEFSWTFVPMLDASMAQKARTTLT
jgi:hypothetical protein